MHLRNFSYILKVLYNISNSLQRSLSSYRGSLGTWVSRQSICITHVHFVYKNKSKRGKNKVILRIVTLLWHCLQYVTHVTHLGTSRIGEVQKHNQTISWPQNGNKHLSHIFINGVKQILGWNLSEAHGVDSEIFDIHPQIAPNWCIQRFTSSERANVSSNNVSDLSR